MLKSFFSKNTSYQSIPLSPDKVNAFFKACKNGDVTAITQYIEQGGDINKTDKNDCSGLIYAVEARQLGVVEYLISQVNSKTLIRARRPTDLEDALGEGTSMNALACACQATPADNSIGTDTKHKIIKVLLNSNASWQNLAVLWDLLEGDKIATNLIKTELVLQSIKYAALGKSYRTYYKEQSYFEKAHQDPEFLATRVKNIFKEIPPQDQQKFLNFLSVAKITMSREELGIVVETSKSNKKSPGNFFENTVITKNDNNNDDKNLEDWLNESSSSSYSSN